MGHETDKAIEAIQATPEREKGLFVPISLGLLAVFLLTLVIAAVLYFASAGTRSNRWGDALLIGGLLFGLGPVLSLSGLIISLLKLNHSEVGGFAIKMAVVWGFILLMLVGSAFYLMF